MALTTTTLSSAVAINDNSIVVASATSLVAGSQLRIDDEWMQVAQTYVSGTTVPVLRGQNGTAVAAHPSSANVVHGPAVDYDNAPNGAYGANTVPSQRARRVVSYSAAGAIEHPNSGEDMVAVINGTGTLAMTVAAPSKDIDGSILYIMGNGKSQSTVTFASGIGNAGSSYDVITFQNAGNVGISVMAVNGFWSLVNGPITGTTTALSTAVA